MHISTICHSVVLSVYLTTLLHVTWCEEEVVLKLGNINPALNLDGKKLMKPRVTNSPRDKRNNESLNNSMASALPCGSNECKNHGTCLFKNLTLITCRCFENWSGDRCNIKSKTMFANYVVYALAIVGGVLFLIIFALTCHCYKRARIIKRRKRLETLQRTKILSTISFTSDESSDGAKKLVYDNEAYSQTDSSDSSSKKILQSINSNKTIGQTTDNSRVFHFSLNKNQKNSESNISDHVIVELDGDEDQRASSEDSSASVSERESPDRSDDADDEDNLSDEFSNRIKVALTDCSDLPQAIGFYSKHNRSIDDIYNEYCKQKRYYHDEERRNSANLNLGKPAINPYMYYTTPNRGKNRHAKKLEQFPQHTLNKHNYKQVKVNTRTRKRKLSEDVLRSPRLQASYSKNMNTRSCSLGDLTSVSSDYLRPNGDNLRLTTFGSSGNILNAHTSRRQGNLITARDQKKKGIWAKTNERT